MAEEIKQETARKEKEFLSLFVQPKGRRMYQNKKGDYSFLCPPGLKIDGKELGGYSLYLKAERLKDIKVYPNSPKWVVDKFNKEEKQVFFPKQLENGDTYNVLLSFKDEETGAKDTVEIPAEKFVPAVIEQIKANTKYAKENAKEKKQEKATNAPAHDSIESNKEVATGAHTAGPDKNLDQR